MPSGSADQTSKPWRIWIDTGGTFTDCLALDPAGRLHRAKVLSSAALRGRIVQQIDATHLRIAQNWDACDDLVGGFAFDMTDRGVGGSSRVLHFGASDSILELERPLERSVAGDAAFEVRTSMPAPILAARLVTRTPSHKPLPPMRMRLATTRGTNALLERRGAAIALFITHGFADLLSIGDQQRPDLFALRIEKPPPLYEHVVEVRERLAADGSVLIPLDAEDVARHGQRLAQAGATTAAVALMHSHVNAQHEAAVASALRRVGFTHVSCSAELAPFIRLLDRAQTAVVNAYLAPVMEAYLRDVERHADPTTPTASTSTALHVMTSAGGLAAANSFRACDGLLSGPAGGVAGAAAAAAHSGFTRVISFDMGGTSTDVARFDGDFDYRFEHKVAGVRLMAPALAIETVAAGGGSICDLTDERLTVGPRSAGAVPGPACYGAGGPLALTDVNLLLGRLDQSRFEIPIDRAAAAAAAERVRARIADPPLIEAMLQGFLEIANQRVAAAIETISVRQGYDPGDYALVAFGGAGGQHGGAVAQRLGIATVIMPADASLLSAAGVGAAAFERFAHRQVLRTLDQCRDEIDPIIGDLVEQATSAVAAEGFDRERITLRRILISARLLGQDSSLAIDVDARDARRAARSLADRFAAQYRATYGHDPPIGGTGGPVKPIEIESIRVVASSSSPFQALPESPVSNARHASQSRRVRAHFDGQWLDVPAIERAELQRGDTINGPALIFDRRSTCVIEPGWLADLDSAGAIIARREAGKTGVTQATQHDAVRLELFSNRFASIADDMGQMLQRTALSTNVKERLDFSCAVLDAQGQLVVNAQHIPVHLGSLGICVRAVREALPFDDGDVVVTNHPAFGGSHLPDVTVITPVFGAGGGNLLGYVASRAHHAEIGGTRPGSMPPAATTLAEEGIVIEPCHIVRRGVSCFEWLEGLLRGGLHPSRAVADNIADLQAAVAANHRGATALRELARQVGPDVVAREMSAIADRAERLARAAIARLPRRRLEALERLDDGSPIQVVIDVQGDRAIVDFAGSASQHPGNLNATPAIVTSAVMYALRVLIGERLPLNEGIMRAVELRIPPGMLNPRFDPDPAKSPAVVGGNTETSQRLVDTLLKALGLCACSQGTMNNVLFGNSTMGYYETVCGGSGAGPSVGGFDGADAVHTHMTNTRITDPELIEHRYPVRVERFAIRRGSGGRGHYRGGDGAIRELTFLAPMSLSVLTQHRSERPYGLEGGEPGAPGRQRVIRAGGDVIQLASIDGCEVAAGDRLILETPGGGGFGAEHER